MSLRDPTKEHPLYIPHDAIIFDFSMGEAREAAGEGCLLLQRLTKEVGDCDDGLLLACEKSTGPFINFQIITGTELERVRSVSRHSPADDPFEMKLQPVFEGWDRFEILVPDGTQSSRDIWKRPFNTTPSSESSIALMKGWLHDCLTNHPTCRNPSLTLLPTRLLRIPAARECGEMVQLWNTKGQKDVRYMALSYCWGSQGQMITTGSNIQSHMHGIASALLPKTVQDAIQVARSLAISNLWIDSLCIIQDDPADKAAEIAQMPIVYSHATLTLKASRSSDVHKGFLGERSNIFDAIKGNQFQIRHRCLKGTLELVDIFPLVNEFFTEPLDTRAWALQERFLSSRLLDIGTYQTRWICQLKGDGISADGYRGVLVNGEQTLDHLSRTTQSLLKGENPINAEIPHVSEDFPIEPYKLWRKLVRIYGRRKLTSQSDRLPAISGLAIRFASLIDDQYCAGLWKSRLPYDLLWYTYNDLDGICAGLNGPSWSWSSVSGSVNFLDNYPDNKTPAASLKITDCRTEPRDGGGLYGAVDSGTLTLTGRLQEALLYWAGWHPWERATLQRSGDGTCPNEKLPEVYVGIDPRSSMEYGQPGVPVTLLKILSSNHGIQGLILHRRSGSEYSRLGVFDCSWYTSLSLATDGSNCVGGSDRYKSYARWFDSGEVKMITIV